MGIWDKCKQMVGKGKAPEPEYVNVLTYAPLPLQATRIDQLLGYEVPAIRQSLNSFLYIGFYQSNQVPSADVWAYQQASYNSTYAQLPTYRDPTGNLYQIGALPWQGGDPSSVIIDVQ